MFSVGGQHRSTTKTLTNWEKNTPQIHLHLGLCQLVHATHYSPTRWSFHTSFLPSGPLVLEQPRSVLRLGLFLKQHLIKVPHPCTKITQQYQLGLTLGTRHSRWNQVERQTNRAPCPLSSAGRHTWRSYLWLPPFKKKIQKFRSVKNCVVSRAKAI
jgi:hypothetical protein